MPFLAWLTKNLEKASCESLNLLLCFMLLVVTYARFSNICRELGIGFECIWDSSIQEIIRIVRANSSKLLRTLVVQPGAVKPSKASKATASQETVPGKKAERRARLVVALTRARLQLDLEQHLADTGVVKSLEILDSMDAHLTKSVKHLCTSYAVHFPEICRNGVLVGVDDFAFASIVTHCPLRDDLVKERDRLVEWLDGNQELADKIISLANSSTGQHLASDDVKVLQQYGQFLLNLLKVCVASVLCFLSPYKQFKPLFSFSLVAHTMLRVIGGSS